MKKPNKEEIKKFIEEAAEHGVIFRSPAEVRSIIGRQWEDPTKPWALVFSVFFGRS